MSEGSLGLDFPAADVCGRNETMMKLKRSKMLSQLLIGLLTSAVCTRLSAADQSVTYSLADDFSYTHNNHDSTWSYRLDDGDRAAPSFPLLPSCDRDANMLWGSDFPLPPKMWSDTTGYWGIGKNTTGEVLVSTRNGTRWAPGEVLLHPKGGDAPVRLVIAWRAPSNLVINVRYAVGPASEHGNGIGYRITWRSRENDVDIVTLPNVRGGIANRLTGIGVAQGDLLLFRIDDCGDPGGDICRADIRIEAAAGNDSPAPSVWPTGGTVVAGSDLRLRVSTTAASVFQWCKDGHPIAGATNPVYRIPEVTLTDAGTYSVLCDGVPRGESVLGVEPTPVVPERYASPTPRQRFSETLSEQELELQANELQRRFAESRRRLAADRYRPAYHFVSPESQMNDPNGLCHWQGRWHLFYQAYPPDEFPNPDDIPKRRQHWGHAVSEDLVRWRDLPYAIYPGVERMCFSGGTVVEPDRVVAFYPGIGAGQMVAVSDDPLLLNWHKLDANPVIPGGAGDACIWKEDDTYLGLIGRGLWTSTDLVHWVPHGEFVTGVEGSCPNFLPIGDKHILLSFSHVHGGEYLLGDYDRQQRRFQATRRGRFNHGYVAPGGVHAPSAAADGRGGVINILNLNDAKPSPDWDQIMSLPQQLTLGPDQRLEIQPVEAVATLRGQVQHVTRTALPAGKEVVLDTIRGNTLELDVEIDPQLARWVEMRVLRSRQAEEFTSIVLYNFDRKLSVWYDTPAVACLDGSRSSTLPDVWLRPPEQTALSQVVRDGASAPAATIPPDKPWKLRVFLDRSVVEVFVNETEYLAIRVYPGRTDSLGVSLRAQGRDAVLNKLDAWPMRSIWP